MKRAFDVILSVVGLTILSPLFLGVAIAIGLGSRGPVFFRQARVGRGGRIFTILKFRSMSLSESLEKEGPSITVADDARVTSIGRHLRAMKVDELPQLLNVLSGNMSLVGPRPEVPKYVAMWTPAQRAAILSVRPGITDPVSIMLRRESELLSLQEDPESYYATVLLPEKAALYEEYVRTRTFLSDLKILIYTARSVIAD